MGVKACSNRQGCVIIQAVNYKEKDLVLLFVVWDCGYSYLGWNSLGKPTRALSLKKKKKTLTVIVFL